MKGAITVEIMKLDMNSQPKKAQLLCSNRETFIEQVSKYSVELTRSHCGEENHKEAKNRATPRKQNTII